MKALTPDHVTTRTGLPAYLAIPSRRSASNHVMRPDTASFANLQRVGRVSDFATNEKARRNIPPNRVRYPTDRQFASGCSPPRLMTTQLPSATGPWLTPARTYTVLLWHLHRRTHSGEGRNPDVWTPAFAGVTVYSYYRFVQISPIRVFLLNQPELPFSMPAFQPLFTRDGRFHRIV